MTAARTNSGSSPVAGSVGRFDDGATPLGPRAGWPPALCTALDLMMSSGFAMCTVWGPAQTLLYNDAYARFLGARHPAALGRPLREAWPEIWDELQPLIRQVMGGEPVHLVDRRFTTTRNGFDEETYWTFSFSPLRDGEAVRGFLDIAVETTGSVLAARRRDEVDASMRDRNDALTQEVVDRTDERDVAREGESAARANAERVQRALEAGAIIGTWVWDLPTDRVAVDEAFATSFGLDPVLGRSGLAPAQVVETVHPDDRDGLVAAIGDPLARGGRFAHQFRTRRRDGRYGWLEANGQVELGPDGKPLRFPGVLIDAEERRALAEERDRALTELRELNETLEERVTERTDALRISEEALRQSQKMEAVGQLTGGLAHDFNNLLTGISGSLEMVSTRIAQGRLRDVERYVIAAQGAAARAASLTHRLLAFSRRQTLEPKATDVNALVNGMLDLVRRTVGPGVRVEAVGMAGLWPALVDRSQLENALLNLCLNARDAMPGGGTITIETGNRWIDRQGARQHDVPEGQYLSLSVSDTGTGMSAAVAARAFEPFFTTKPLGQGTGLGLSMIYGFAKQSGGHARIYSEPGHGTNVSVYLPRHRGEADENEGIADIGPPATATAGKTVLIVEDEPMIRMLAADVLGELGYAVIEAADGGSGLKVLQSDAPVDLVVSDLGLPGPMNGREMIDAARRGRPELRVLFITGFAENALLNNGQLEPGVSVLTKPFAIGTLVARVREMIN